MRIQFINQQHFHISFFLSQFSSLYITLQISFTNTTPPSVKCFSFSFCFSSHSVFRLTWVFFLSAFFFCNLRLTCDLFFPLPIIQFCIIDIKGFNWQMLSLHREQKYSVLIRAWYLLCWMMYRIWCSVGLGLGSLGSCWLHLFPVWTQPIVLYGEELDWNREGKGKGKCEWSDVLILMEA